jgi:Holliday junction resolvasome RuvABC endonuclease subunit
VKIMGVDLGVHKVAVAVLEGEELTHAVPNHTTTDRPRDLVLHSLAGMVCNVAQLYDVDQVWIEDTIIGNNRKYSIGLAETKGAVMSELAQLRLLRGLDVRLVDNQTWKREVVGNGHASKDEIRDYIRVTHGAYAPLCGDDQDLYDAACIGLYGSHVSTLAGSLRLSDQTSD